MEDVKRESKRIKLRKNQNSELILSLNREFEKRDREREKQAKIRAFLLKKSALGRNHPEIGKYDPNCKSMIEIVYPKDVLNRKLSAVQILSGSQEAALRRREFKKKISQSSMENEEK